MSLLKQDIIKKKQIGKNVIELKAGKDNNKYKIKAIFNSAIYAKKLMDYLLRLYYFVF